MTRTSLSALFITICFTGLVSGLRISLWQNPEWIEWRGTNASITCYIKAHLGVQEIMVKWLQDNRTTIMSNSFKVSYHPSSVNGFVFINATLNLLSIRLNHSGMYYCSARVNVPVLEPAEYGNGTYVYVVLNSSTVTPPTLTPNPYNMETLRWSVISGMGFVLLIICIACVIHIHFKGHCRIEPRAKEALVDATRGSHCSDTWENVVYAAISMSSRNENCPASTRTSVTCTEESVTYSEVRIKKGPKEEGYCLAEFYSQ